jgi:hypothetical protein
MSTKTCGDCAHCENDSNYRIWGRCVAPVPVIALRRPDETIQTDVRKEDAQAEWCRAFRQKEGER